MGNAAFALGATTHASRCDCFCGYRDIYFARHIYGARSITFSETEISWGDSSSQQTSRRENEVCRREAQKLKLHFLRRRRFIRDCVKKNP
jgi:hypothetical protein